MKGSMHLFFYIAAIMAHGQYIPAFDLQGHRGARGLKPENTIPAFIEALNWGVTTLELDVVITRDGQVVVSHEPWMSASICLQPNGSKIPPAEEKQFNIFNLTYQEVRAFDCGSAGHSQFPHQQSVAAYKPLLHEVIAAVEDHIKSYTQYEVDYNIEIKSHPSGDGRFHPAPDEFSNLVYGEISQYLPLERVIIQSFDLRVLQYWKKNFPQVRLALLVENRRSVEQNLKALGFTPSIYSPHYKLLTRQAVQQIQSAGMQVIPWTVNEEADMRRLRMWGVNGIITDYPDRAAGIGLGLKPTGPALKKNGLR